MKNPLAYTFKATIWNGRFCWENARWEYNPAWKDFWFGVLSGWMTFSFFF